jgi:hypothetical protein
MVDTPDQSQRGSGHAPDAALNMEFMEGFHPDFNVGLLTIFMIFLGLVGGFGVLFQLR